MKPVREREGLGFALMAAGGMGAAVLALVVMLGDVLLDGFGHLSLHFFTNFASRFPERAGIRAPLAGTLWLLSLTALFSFPISLGAAIHLEEYAPRNRVTRLVETSVANLAGVPSIVYGILGLALFVRWMRLGPTVLAGALTLSVMITPIMVLAIREALRKVPGEIREAGYGLGASRWQVVRFQVLPQAWPGILSGVVRALARAVGETAPLIMVGAVTFIAFTPETAGDPFTALPVQIFHWITRPQQEFRALAAAAVIVLLAMLLLLNGAAMIIRSRLQRRERGG